MKKTFYKLGEKVTISNPEKIRNIERKIIKEALILAWKIWDGKAELRIPKTPWKIPTSDFEDLIIRYQKSSIYKWRHRNHGRSKSI